MTGVSNDASSDSARAASRRVRLLHVSDIHCGPSFVAAHVNGALRIAETLAKTDGLDAIVVSGDLSHRAREVELRAGRAVLDQFASIAPMLTVPGNHDTEWWHAPFGIGARTRLYERWKQFVTPETQPTLRVPGVSIVGMNSAAGMLPQALTWYPRDWRVKGGVTQADLDHARQRLAVSATGDLRILVLHHNPVRGRLSNRWGLTRPHSMLDALATIGADVVCSGHDHEERVECVVRRTGSVVSSTANTLSNRARGHRTTAVTVIEADAQEITVTIWPYDAPRAAFAPGATSRFPRFAR